MQDLTVLVCGANGLVGHQLVDFLKTKHKVIAVAKQNEKLFDQNVHFVEYNFIEYTEFSKILDEYKPDCIINCAAFTNVDLCEIEKENAMKINHHFVQELITWAVKNNAHLIHISTDYIFDGKNGPYLEDDNYKPLNHYGLSKLNADLEIINTENLRFTLFRAVVIYGYHRNRNKLNFITWLIENLKAGKKLNIVTDQSSNYTYVNDLVIAIANSINSHFGIFNIAGDYYASRYELSLKVAKTLALNSDLIKPVLTKDLKQKAIRPKKSGLINQKAKKTLNFLSQKIESTLLEINKHLSS